MSEIEKIKKRNYKRKEWASKAIRGGTWRLVNREPTFFAGGRSCTICGHFLHNAFELQSTSGAVALVGKECLITAVAYQAGAFDE